MESNISCQPTISSLEAKIRELEQENAMLKSRLDVKPRRDMWPESILCKYGLVIKSVNKSAGFWLGNGEYLDRTGHSDFPRDFQEKLSRIIRWAIFGGTAARTAKGHRQLISVANMTDEEFKIYLHVLDRVLSAFDEGLKKLQGADI